MFCDAIKTQAYVIMLEHVWVHTKITEIEQLYTNKHKDMRLADILEIKNSRSTYACTNVVPYLQNFFET